MKTILVTGDPICDHNYYKGVRSSAISPEQRGFREECMGGGALLLKELLSTVIKTAAEAQAEAAAQAMAKSAADGKGEPAQQMLPAWQVKFGLNEDFKTLPAAYHSFCIWEPQDGPKDKESEKPPQFWRMIEPPLGYGPKDEVDARVIENGLRKTVYDVQPDAYMPNPDIVVIDDAGLGFCKEEHKEAHSALCGCLEGDDNNTCPEWVVLKLTGLVSNNALLEKLTAQCANRLVVIVPAGDLRLQEVRLSKGLSWEATAEDLSAELKNNPRLAPLLKARHLIVPFQSDAAYWLEQTETDKRALLVFDAKRAEGEWAESQGAGNAYGYLSCFTAAIVNALSLPSAPQHHPDLEIAIRAGLGAGRTLRQIGHGALLEEKAQPGFPSAQIAAAIFELHDEFVSAVIPLDAGTKKDRGDWMMLDEWQVHARNSSKPRPYYDGALAVAVLGSEALERFPVAQFGSYQTVDRKEIESLRTIRQLIMSYINGGRQKKPLNLGVFGPPGSGKSYIVLEIAAAVGIKEKDVKVFNLSQFKDPADLFGAFHQVRDMVLKGTTPLIFWDEFDAQGYRWLQYLLAPMEDGEFQDGQITHPIGKCIFVFAGATSSTFDKFGPVDPDQIEKKDIELLLENTNRLQEVERGWKDFVLAKGPDFKSRLVGYLNILGANRKLSCDEKAGRRVWVEDATDLCFPIRRALFMRSLFKVEKGERLKLDTQIIKALLEMPKFKGGGRSLEFLCKHMKDSAANPGRSSLPGSELLNMHVDAALFWDLCERDMDFAAAAVMLAEGLHQDWLSNLTAEERENNENAKPWDKLDDDPRNSSVAQAARIPAIVALAGLRVVRGEPLSADDAERIKKTMEEHAEVLAEAEHNGWMIERMLAGWRYARLPKKDKNRKLHPLLIPYAQLHAIEQAKDKRIIQGQKAAAPAPVVPNYLERVQRVGFRIEPVPEKAEAAG